VETKIPRAGFARLVPLIRARQIPYANASACLDVNRYSSQLFGSPLGLRCHPCNALEHEREQTCRTDLWKTNLCLELSAPIKGIATGFRAWEMAAGLEAELKPAVEIVTDLWEFELLADPQLRGCAVADAAASDMVVISAGRGCELPAHVNKWMQTWLDRTRSRPAALVALLDQGRMVRCSAFVVFTPAPDGGARPPGLFLQDGGLGAR